MQQKQRQSCTEERGIMRRLWRRTAEMEWVHVTRPVRSDRVVYGSDFWNE